MTQTSGAARSYRQGEWFGIFGTHVTVLLPAGEKARVAALWELVDADAGFDETLDALIAPGLRGLPGFALVSNGAEQTRVLLRGDAHAWLTLADGSDVEVSGGAAATWVERTLDGVTALTLEVGGAEVQGEDLPINGGLVRVARVDQPPYAEDVAVAPAAPVAPVVVEEAEAEPEVAPEPVLAPVVATDPAADLVTEQIDLSAGQPAPPAFPLGEAQGNVWAPPPPPSNPFGAPPGFEAPGAAVPPPPAYPPVDPGDIDHDGHTVAGGWDPNQFARQQPGIPGQPQAPSVTAVPVAKLVFSSGETVEVDRAVLIGRAPEARRFTSTEQPRLVTVPSPNQEISSTHLEVRPGSGADHGSAVVTDMGSTNGTVLQLPGLPPEDLQPGIAVQLIPGSVIDLGDGVTVQVTHP